MSGVVPERKKQPATHSALADLGVLVNEQREGIDRTRYYMHVFMDTLRECGHQPEHVRQVMRELLDGTPGVPVVDSKTLSQNTPMVGEDTSRAP